MTDFKCEAAAGSVQFAPDGWCVVLKISGQAATNMYAPQKMYYFCGSVSGEHSACEMQSLVFHQVLCEVWPAESLMGPV